MSGPKIKLRAERGVWHLQRSPMRISQAILQSHDELHKNEPLRKTIEESKEGWFGKAKKKDFTPVA
jgi:hypothetical protein